MDIFSDAPEQQAASATPAPARRHLGQFFTPFAVARFMAAWVGQPAHIRTVLDPAVGLGVFFRALAHAWPAARRQYTGYDVDERLLSQAQRLLAALPHADVTLRPHDFLAHGWDERYDAVIANPPYLKFQAHGDRAARQADFAQRLGLALTGLTNLYSLFLLKGLHQLAAGGRAAFLVPSEFLNTGYGERVKAALLASRALRFVVVMDTRAAVFDGALTTACLLLFAKDERDTPVEFITLPDAAALAGLTPHILSYPAPRPWQTAIPAAQLQPATKWHAYYAPAAARPSGPLVPFRTYAQVTRGIATGANGYFCFSASRLQACGIPAARALPCLTKARQAAGSFFTANDFARLDGQDRPVWLLNAAGGEAEAAIQRYLHAGEGQGLHRRHLTRHRTPWYALERRPPAPLLVTVFNRGGLRFVKNEASVYNLTCFHSIYVEAAHRAKLDLFAAWLLTDVAREILNAEQRHYGDGLDKFEPNDLNRAQVVDLYAVEAGTEARILALYRALRAQEQAAHDTGETRAALNRQFADALRVEVG